MLFCNLKQNNRSDDLNTIPQTTQQATSLIKVFRLFLKKGVIHTVGRIDNTNLPYKTRNPLLLLKKHHFTKLVIQKCHEVTLHSGVTQTLPKVREEFWIPQGGQIIKNVIKNCSLCKRLQGPKDCLPPAP